MNRILEMKEPLTPAVLILREAEVILAQRGAIYENKTSERSMDKIVNCFAMLTGKTLMPSDGYIFMALLKLVRANNAPSYHHDSYVDAINYIALAAEAHQVEE